MDESEQLEEESPSFGGLGGSIRETLVGFLDYLEARLNLLQFEAREAGSDLVIRLICFVVAGLFAVVAYLGLLTAVIGWLSTAQDWPWYFVTLAAAGLHLLVGVILVLVARRKFSRPPFRDSLAELESDRQWLEDMRGKR